MRGAVRRLPPTLFIAFCAFCWTASAQALFMMRYPLEIACSSAAECANSLQLDVHTLSSLALVGVGPTGWAVFCIAVHAFAVLLFSVLGIAIALGGAGMRRWFLAATWPALGFGPIAQFSEWPIARLALPAVGLAGFFWSLAAFPTSRVQPRWARIPVVAGAVLALVFFAVPSVVDALARGEQPWWGLEGPAGLSVTGGILAAQMVRFRRSDASVRRYQGQLVLALGIMLAGGGAAATLAAIPGVGHGTLPVLLLQLGGVLTTVIVAVVITAATIAGRAYGVRVVVDHVLSGAVLCGLAVLGYVAAVAVASVIAPPGIAAAVAAIVTALVLAGAVGRVLRGIDRLVYGDAAQPARVVAAVGQVVETARRADTIVPEMLYVAAEKLLIPVLSLVLPDGETFGATVGGDAGPAPVRTDASRHEPLSLEDATGQPFATALVGLRRGQLHLSRRDREAVRSLASPLAAALAVRRLTVAADTAQRRSATASERERVALRRLLHDGVGPALASARYRLDAMAADVPCLIDIADPQERVRVGSAVRAHVDSARDAVADAYAQVRDVSRELRPPVLDEQGLAAALARYAVDAGITARIDATARVGEPQSSALYRVGVESIANAVRHGGAQNVSVVLALHADAVMLRITDDGCGMPERVVPGVGLRSMRERVAGLGGVLSIAPDSAGGVSVTATVPCDGAGVAMPGVEWVSLS